MNIIKVQIKPNISKAMQFDCYSKIPNFIEMKEDREDCGFEYRYYKYYYIKKTGQRIYNGWWLVENDNGEWKGYNEKEFEQIFEKIETIDNIIKNTIMIGKRVITDPFYFQNGDYGLYEGCWYGLTPNGHLANLGGHDVIEHPDGTITVSPSIRVWSSSNFMSCDWHGYLEKGIWREC